MSLPNLSVKLKSKESLENQMIQILYLEKMKYVLHLVIQMDKRKMEIIWRIKKYDKNKMLTL